MSPEARAWRNRGVSLGVVVAFLGIARVGVPDAEGRATLLYVAVIALGYGHLIGGAWFARRHIAGAAPRPLHGPLGVAFAVSALALGLLLYLEATLRSSLVVVPLLALSVWHALENDQSLAVLYSGRRSPRPAWGRGQVAALGLGLAAGGLFAASLVGSVPLQPAEVFALSTLYHVVSWLLFSLERRRARCAVLAVHVLPAAACGALLWAPLPWEHPLRVAAFAPAIYLFWAALHVVQTLWVRPAAALPQT